ncbi:MAG: hypothetical protein HYX67_13840 [Candidatus Melainabacteria bacterium]|nr:hypothetical protein [Candidatus Melainabacteria bacterium]
MEGNALLKLLIESTGLPPEAVERELGKILTKAKIQPEELTLEKVREILSTYLQDVLIEAKQNAG